MDNKPSTISYTDEFENFLKQESEKSECMSILHSMAWQSYNTYSVSINIPVIVLSSIIGFLSPLQLFEEQNILLGAFSIVVAIIKTLDNYFDWTKRSENHRLTSLTYSKISKFIQIQLSLEKNCRIVADDILSVITNDLQNLKDSEPPIPEFIIKSFNIKYKDDKTTKPTIANGLTSVIINKKDSIIPIVPKVELEIKDSEEKQKKIPIWKK
jgi:hypothetical protein